MGPGQAIQEYEKLAPEDANALDSLGDVSFYLGDFESAAKYFEQAAQKSPPEFLKAAEARLMTGDLGSADALFAKYVGPVKGGRAAYQMAQWEFLTGRRMKAIEAMEKLVGSLDGESQKLARRQLAVWEVEAGDSRALGSIEADWATLAVVGRQISRRATSVGGRVSESEPFQRRCYSRVAGLGSGRDRFHRSGGEIDRDLPPPAFIGRADVRFPDLPALLCAARSGVREAGKSGRGEKESRAFYKIRRRSYEVAALCSQGLSASPWSRCSTRS